MICNFFRRISNYRVGRHVLGKRRIRLIGHGDDRLHLVRGHRVIESVGRGNRADQDQHDEAHASWPSFEPWE